MREDGSIRGERVGGSRAMDGNGVGGGGLVESGDQN